MAWGRRVSNVTCIVASCHPGFRCGQCASYCLILSHLHVASHVTGSKGFQTWWCTSKLKSILDCFIDYIFIYTHVYLYLICRIICISHISCQYVHNTCSEFIRDSGDDRNVRDGDGCSSTCQVELGYTCSRSDSAHVDVCHGQTTHLYRGRSFFFSACSSSPYYSYLVHVYALAHVHVEELYKDSKSFF